MTTKLFESEEDKLKFKDLGIIQTEILLTSGRIPYNLARTVCLEKCYKIRHYLAPLFGPDFVNECVQVEVSDEKQIKGRPGRKPRSPSSPVKRAAEGDMDPTTYERIPRK